MYYFQFWFSLNFDYFELEYFLLYYYIYLKILRFLLNNLIKVCMNLLYKLYNFFGNYFFFELINFNKTTLICNWKNKKNTFILFKFIK